MEFEPRIFHVDIVSRRIRDRSIDSENRQLDRLPGFNAASYDESVLRVPAFDHRAAALARGARDFTIDPNFRVIVERCREDQSRTRGIKGPDALRHGDLEPVPVKSELAGGAPFVERGRIDDFPLGIVEVGAAGVWRKVIPSVRDRAWLAIRARGFEIDLDDLRRCSATRF